MDKLLNRNVDQRKHDLSVEKMWEMLEELKEDLGLAHKQKQAYKSDQPFGSEKPKASSRTSDNGVKSEQYGFHGPAAEPLNSQNHQSQLKVAQSQTFKKSDSELDVETTTENSYNLDSVFTQLRHEEKEMDANVRKQSSVMSHSSISSNETEDESFSSIKLTSIKEEPARETSLDQLNDSLNSSKLNSPFVSSLSLKTSSGTLIKDITKPLSFRASDRSSKAFSPRSDRLTSLHGDEKSDRERKLSVDKKQPDTAQRKANATEAPQSQVRRSFLDEIRDDAFQHSVSEARHHQDNNVELVASLQALKNNALKPKSSGTAVKSDVESSDDSETDNNEFF